MKFGTVSSATVAESGRWDAKYHLLLEEHRAVYDELIAKFTVEELVALAKKLPYDKQAAECVCTSMNSGTFGKSRGQSYFNEWLDSFVSKKYPPTRPTKYREIAVYIAAAAQFTVSKVLEDVLALTQAKKDKLEELKCLLSSAKEKQATELLAAFKRSS